MGGRGRRKIERTVRREYGSAVAFVKSSRARKAVGMEGDGERGQGQNARGLLPFPISRYAPVTILSRAMRNSKPRRFRANGTGVRGLNDSGEIGSDGPRTEGHIRLCTIEYRSSLEFAGISSLSIVYRI